MRLIDADTLKARFAKNQYYSAEAICEKCDNAPTEGARWIPFVKRPLTEDEKNTHPDWCYILEGSAPEDEEEILIYRPWKNSEGYIITMDQYMNNGAECYLDGAGDIENGMFWMPLPEPPKEEA